jgi:hypothetical protein
VSFKRYDWFGIFDWLVDKFVFSRYPILQSDFPETKPDGDAESSDDHLRKLAREADALEKSAKDKQQKGPRSRPLPILALLVLTAATSRADSSQMQSEAKMGDQTRYRTPIVFKQINFDFDNNTLSEMVIKLNTMIRGELRDRRGENVLLDLTGLSESDITTVLNRKVVHWQPAPGLALEQILGQIAQFTNCTLTRKDADLILSPNSPFTSRTFDAQVMAASTPNAATSADSK